MVTLPEKKGLSLKEAGRLSKTNLYKYKPNCSLPMTLSLLSYCKAFKIDPDWMIRIAGMVESGQLKEDQAIEMLMRWPEFKPVIDNACEIALNGIMEKLSR
jgi:hypothetical protein